MHTAELNNKQVRKLANIPTPSLQPRKVDPNILQQALLENLDPVIARIVAARRLPKRHGPSQILAPKLADLDSPFLLKDIDKAAKRLADAILQGEVIGIETDHDCDGQTAHAVMYYTLVQHFHVPKEKLRSYIGHRLKEGYGLSESLCQRILKDSPKPNLVLTADNGSSDEPRIKQLKAQGIDVIVTDHHAIPKEGIPESAYACLNPTREDCGYPDPYIAGCFVAWLLMAATRKMLIEQSYLPQHAPHLEDSLDYVALGTIADCVSMARSQNNRVVVRYGMQRIAKATKPCWQAILPLIHGELSSEDLGFKLGPLLNSDGRLSSALNSVSFLLSETLAEAETWIDALTEQNQERKAIQKHLTQQGIALAIEQVAQKKPALVIYLEQGHAGVHGICASRVKDMFGRPCVFLTPKSNDASIVTGSVRGITGFHVQKVLQAVATEHPDLFLSFGGHEGAGGVNFPAEKQPLFEKSFHQHAANQLSTLHLGPVIYTDGKLAPRYFTVSFVEKLQTLEPFGREFEPPIFEASATILGFKPVGDGTHARVNLLIEDQRVGGIWFGFRQSQEDSILVHKGDKVQVAFSLKINRFQGSRRLDLLVVTMQVLKP